MSKKAENVRTIAVNGKILPLTPLEYDVFRMLKSGAGTVFSRETLLRDIWGYQCLVDTRTVDMCVKRLREKIGKERILTVYGQGYMMVS